MHGFPIAQHHGAEVGAAEYRSDGRLNPDPRPELQLLGMHPQVRLRESPEQLPEHRVHCQSQGLDDHGLRPMGPHQLALQAQISNGEIQPYGAKKSVKMVVL